MADEFKSMIGFLYKRCIEDQDYVQCKICHKRVRHRGKSMNLEAHISIHSRDLKQGGPLPKIRYSKKAYQSLLVRSTMMLLGPRPDREPSMAKMMPLMLALRQAAEQSDSDTDESIDSPASEEQSEMKAMTSTPFHSGIDPLMISRLKRHTTTIKKMQSKLYFLMWHQIPLTRNLDYVDEEDMIVGFGELEGTHSKMANRALVFMIRRISGEKKQPIAFYYIQSPLESKKLVGCVKDVYTALISAGVNIVATISDHTARNIAAVKILHGGDLRKDTFEIISGKKLVHIFDPPHLLKGVRNNFIKNNIQFDGNDTDGKKIATWAHIKVMCDDEFKKRGKKKGSSWDVPSILGDFNDTFIYKKVLNKNRVSTCTKVFGRVLGLCMNMIAKSEKTNVLSKDAMHTSELILFFYRLFDSVNGHYLTLDACDGNERRIILTKKSYHQRFWTEAMSKLKSMRFVRNNSKETRTVPSLNCWIKTLQSFQTLWKTLEGSDVRFFRTRVANLDPLENLFSAIRIDSKVLKPTPAQFMISYNGLLVRNVLWRYSIRNNCEPDSGKALLDLSDLKETGGVSTNLYHIVRKVRSRPGQEAKRVSHLLLARQSCPSCRDSISKISLQINRTAYKKIASEIQKILQTKIDSNNGRKYTKEELKSRVIEKIQFSFSCIDHGIKFSNDFLDISVTLQIYKFCNNANKFANGELTYKADKLLLFRQLCDQYRNRYKRKNNINLDESGSLSSHHN